MAQKGGFESPYARSDTRLALERNTVMRLLLVAHRIGFEPMDSFRNLPLSRRAL